MKTITAKCGVTDRITNFHKISHELEKILRWNADGKQEFMKVATHPKAGKDHAFRTLEITDLRSETIKSSPEVRHTIKPYQT